MGQNNSRLASRYRHQAGDQHSPGLFELHAVLKKDVCKVRCMRVTWRPADLAAMVKAGVFMHFYDAYDTGEDGTNQMACNPKNPNKPESSVRVEKFQTLTVTRAGQEPSALNKLEAFKPDGPDKWTSTASGAQTQKALKGKHFAFRVFVPSAEATNLFAGGVVAGK